MALKRSQVEHKPMTRAKMPFKKTKRARAKKTPLRKLREELWQVCKQIIRKRYGNTCYTCGAHPLTGSNWHTGHFVARSICGVYLKYDLRNLRPQCYRCNISLAGSGAVFYRNLVERESQAYVDQIFADKQRETKETVGFFQEKIAEYKKIVDNSLTEEKI